MNRVSCALLCLFVLSGCNASSASNLLMMPVKLGTSILKTATRTLGRVAATESQPPEQQEMPKPHSRLPSQPKVDTIEAASKFAATASASPST